MALFSRRSAPASADAAADTATVDEPLDLDPSTDTATSASASDPDPVVGISVSAFQGLGSAAPASSAPPAPDAALSAAPIPGVADNMPVRAALASLPEQPQPAQLLHIARQVLQGQLFLRVKGDAKQLLAAGENIPLAISTVGDKQYVLAFSGGPALRASLAADGARDTSAMAQPAQAVLRFVANGPYAGIILDPASAPARAVLSRELIVQLLDQADPEFTLKRILAGPRDETTPSQFVAAMSTSRLWIATNHPEGSDQMGVAEARTQDGDRLIEVFTHPVEIAALGRGDRPAAVTAAQLGAALAADAELSGLLVDPAGPWIRLSRDDLADLIIAALPDE